MLLLLMLLIIYFTFQDKLANKTIQYINISVYMLAINQNTSFFPSALNRSHYYYYYCHQHGMKI